MEYKWESKQGVKARLNLIPKQYSIEIGIQSKELIHDQFYAYIQTISLQYLKRGPKPQT